MSKIPKCVECGDPLGHHGVSLCDSCDERECPCCGQVSLHVGHRIYC